MKLDWERSTLCVDDKHAATIVAKLAEHGMVCDEDYKLLTPAHRSIVTGKVNLYLAARYFHFVVVTK